MTPPAVVYRTPVPWVKTLRLHKRTQECHRFDLVGNLIVRADPDERRTSCDLENMRFSAEQCREDIPKSCSFVLNFVRGFIEHLLEEFAGVFMALKILSVVYCLCAWF